MAFIDCKLYLIYLARDIRQYCLPKKINLTGEPALVALVKVFPPILLWRFTYSLVIRKFILHNNYSMVISIIT